MGDLNQYRQTRLMFAETAAVLLERKLATKETACDQTPEVFYQLHMTQRQCRQFSLQTRVILEQHGSAQAKTKQQSNNSFEHGCMTKIDKQLTSCDNNSIWLAMQWWYGLQ